MKKSTFILGITVLSTLVLTLQSCGNNQDDGVREMSQHDNSDGHHDSDKKHNQSSDSQADYTNTGQLELIQDYLALKTALTKDNEDKAGEIAEKMTKTIKGFNSDAYTESQESLITDILETSLEHAEHIAKSPIAHQREHFKELSAGMIDLIAITGTSTKLYQQYCPMYDDNKGGSWLSNEKNIVNPYYGSKMLTCGKVEKEYNK